MPTLEMARALSKDRISPMIRIIQYYMEYSVIQKVKMVIIVYYKKFSGGHLTICGANSSSSLSSRPVRIVLLDEVSRFPASAGAEGDQLI